MKTIGLLGGMSWESTLDYYREINTTRIHAAKAVAWATGIAAARH